MAGSAHDIWITADEQNGSPAPFVLHWNGSAWTRTALPVTTGSAIQLSLGADATDGHGGVWVAGGTLHYAKGVWTKVAVHGPKSTFLQVLSSTRVPGTTTLWSTGDLLFGHLPQSEGVVLTYS